MGLGRFLQKTVKAVGKNIGSAGKAVGKNIGSVGKAVGVRTSGGGGGRGFGGLSGAVVRAVQAATPQQVSGSANAGAGLSKEVQDAADVQQRIGQALGRSFNKGGMVSSGRGDGIAVRGKTKCKMY
jgi:hypothetical protein